MKLSEADWKNIKDHLCVICEISIVSVSHSHSYYLCDKCNKVCEITHTEVSDGIIDIKSVCCNSDVEINNKITCSDYCHEKYIEKMIKKDGLFKKVIDLETNIAYMVPTRIIIEEGLRQEQLKNFPEWH